MGRREARTACMQLIYEKLSGGEGGEESLQMIYDELREAGVVPQDDIIREVIETENGPEERIRHTNPDRQDRAMIVRMLEGVLEHLPEIDEKIEAAAQGWTLERMSLVDLTIMRMAAWEILYAEKVPGPVAINEAVNLVKTYSDPTGSRFVNGVLGTILRASEAAGE